MNKQTERLPSLFKSPIQLRIALDLLEQHFGERPERAGPDAGGSAGATGGGDMTPAELAGWCLERLGGEPLRALEKALRLAANHQRVYKRTVALSPRAHLLVKTLAEEEGLKISEVIELHLDPVLRLRAGLAIRTTVDAQSGQVDHRVVTVADPAD